MDNDLYNDLYIDSPAALIDLCARLRDSDWIALDTEFIREKTYYPQLCLLQLADDDVVACIDPLVLADLTPLLAVLYDPAVTKVLHSAYQDLEIFYHLRGQLPAPVFDTQIAATLLGSGEQIGYAGLVKALLDVDLDKSQTRTDWSRRPLSVAQLHYAADDVRYLRDIYRQQHAELERTGRLEWLRDDFSALCDPSLYSVRPDAAWQRVKGGRNLRGVQLAVLQTLAAWREQQAAQSDRPRKWVLSDNSLLDLSRIMPSDMKQMERLRQLDARTLRRHGQTLLELIDRARRLPREQWPMPAPHLQMSAEQEALVDAMMAIIRLRGFQHSVNATTLATRKDLERLLAGDKDIALLHGWRAEIAGHEVQALLRGELRLEVRNGQLHPGFIAGELQTSKRQ